MVSTHHQLKCNCDEKYSFVNNFVFDNDETDSGGTQGYYLYIKMEVALVFHNNPTQPLQLCLGLNATKTMAYGRFGGCKKKRGVYFFKKGRERSLLVVNTFCDVILFFVDLLVLLLAVAVLIGEEVEN